MYVSDIDAYHKIIIDSYDERSKVYSNSQWHRSLAEKLVDNYPPDRDDSILDIGTGTGTAAFRAASYAGPLGRVVGVDLSKGMIEEASKLSKQSAYKILFQVADGERLTFPENIFNRIYCASAFFWIANKEKALSYWFSLLKPGGVLGLHAWPEDSYVFGYVARKVLKSYGIEYLAHSPTGTKEKCKALVKSAGYIDIEIIEVNDGHYLSLQDAKDAWITMDHYPIGQYPHPIANVSQEVLTAAKADYDTEMERLNTEKGVWNNTTMYYVYGKKPT